MGCGKTTVGELLAKRCDLPLIDTDAYIVQREGKSIPKIFAEDGEPYFRECETEAIVSLCRENAVVSLGGGTLMNPKSAAAAQENGIVVFLDAPFDLCYTRIAYDMNRPLVQQNTRKELEALYNKRRAVYLETATHVIAADDTPQAIVDEIMARIS